MGECPCFYFDLAEEDPEAGLAFCECGHVDDEHDDDGDCKVVLAEIGQADGG